MEDLLWSNARRSAAFAELGNAYETGSAGRVGEIDGRTLVGFAGWEVPVSKVRARGGQPVVIAPGPRRPTPLADQFMEDSFPWATRAVLDQLLSGTWAAARLVIVDRSFADVFSYASEARRLGGAADLPPLVMFDSIAESGAGFARHNERQLAALDAALARYLAEEPYGDPALESDFDRQSESLEALAARRLSGSVPGSDALVAIGAGYFLDSGRHARLLGEWLAESTDAPTRSRVVLIASEPLSDVHLHAALEAGGLAVVAEDDGWGSRADFRGVSEPGVGPAVAHGVVDGLERRHAWLLAQALPGRVDGVVISVPITDQVLGWDVPRMRNMLESRGIPVLVLPVDVHEPGGAKRVRQLAEEFAATLADPLRSGVGL